MRYIRRLLKRKQLETIKMSVTGSTTMVTNMSSFKITRFPRWMSRFGGSQRHQLSTIWPNMTNNMIMMTSEDKFIFSCSLGEDLDIGLEISVST